jgi:putative GTP pyrophosphokinase
MHVYFCETTKSVPIEIQIRTKAMDLWASVEHDCRYKNSNPSEEAPEIFNKIAQILNDFDEAAVHLRDNTTV